jgi:phosphotransferase system IIA component
MRSVFLQLGLLLGALSFTTAASAQQIVHGLTGKVTAIYPASKTIHIDTDDGSPVVYDILTQNNVVLNFEKSVKAMTVPASTFTKADCNVVVFYYGDDNARTVVAVEDLGPGPLINNLGTVVKVDKKAHLLTIKSDSGEEATFHIDAKTLADSSYGVMEGQKFSADKGARVRVTATMENGAPTALFIRALSF